MMFQATPLSPLQAMPGVATDRNLTAAENPKYRAEAQSVAAAASATEGT